MWYTLILVVHVLAVALLILVILIQRGRGSGLIEAVSHAESLFGTKTSSMLVRSTAVLAAIFFVTSLSLTFLSKRRNASVTEKYKNILETPTDRSPIRERTAPKMPLKTQPKTDTAPISLPPSSQLPASGSSSAQKAAQVEKTPAAAVATPSPKERTPAQPAHN